MRRIYLLLLLAQGAVLVYGQPNSAFMNLAQRPCPFDPGKSVTQPEYWLLYQTTDGRWDGPMDSSRCISVTSGPNGYGVWVALAQLNLAEPLFARADMAAVQPAEDLLPDWLYNAYLYARVEPFSPSAPVRTGADCADGLCSGALIGIAIPDSAGAPGGATRFQTALCHVSPNNPVSTQLSAASCFPTERFDGQFLREFVLKFSFDSTAVPAGGRLLIYSALLDPIFTPGPGIGYITEVAAATNPVNVQEASGTFWADNFLARYTAPTYPDPQHPSYIEAFPVPNTAVPQHITMTVDPFQTLEIQPFVQFRGGLVAGSDSVRHQFTLENDGGELCVNFIDLIFNGGDKFRHAGGAVTVNHPMSCMQFRRGSALQVAEGATLHYGNDGAGMLVLCANSTLELGRNNTLVIDGTLQIGECDDALPPQQLYVDLPPGARLIFTEHAWLTNRYAQQQLMHLNVRMLGGELDDSRLDAAERALINRIYPVPPPDLADNVKIWPNPYVSLPILYYTAAGAETLRLYWYDMAGRLLQEERLEVAKGLNERAIAAPSAGGVYLLQVETAQGRVALKVAAGQ